MTEPQLEIPDEFDDDSYRAGYDAALESLEELVEMQRSVIARPEAGIGDTNDVCETCGRDLVGAMGSEEPVCPACDV